jgi:hypothetical protein
MGERLNWQVVPDDNNVTTVDPSSVHHYELFNTTVFQVIKYKEREYGINLDWADPDQSNPSIRFQRESGTADPIRFGERFAIHVRDGGYLRYGEREYGINLKWSDDPHYEWRIRREAADANTVVQTTDIVGLFNTIANDYLFYDPRRYGINLKWLRDEGKFNDVPWWENALNAVAGFLNELIDVLKEIGNRVAGLVDAILTLIGIMLPKRLRIRVVILRDVDGRALLGDERLPQAQRDAQMQQVNDAIDVAREVFKKEANVRIRAAGGKLIETLKFPAPASVLDVGCDGEAWADDFKEAGSYFRRHQAANASGNLLGYAAPLTVFVVKDVEGKIGCSLGPLTNYVTVDLEGMAYFRTHGDTRPTTLAHELGHACALWHVKRKKNLMHADRDRGRALGVIQQVVFRDSRHVTFL